MLIQNYGLHWRRDRIHFGKKGLGNEGTLLGRDARYRTSKPVNVREQCGIYILQDDFRPLYIGQTGRKEQKLFSRLKAHTLNHLAERWNRVSWFGILPVKRGKLNQDAATCGISTRTEDLLDHIEGVLIAITEPPLNRQGARFGKAVQFKQFYHLEDG